MYLACSNALGLSTGALPNSAISASSHVNGNEPWRGRLDASGIWCSALTERDYKSSYLQVRNVGGILINPGAMPAPYSYQNKYI